MKVLVNDILIYLPDGGSKAFWNVGILSHHYKASQPRWFWLWSSLLWKPQISWYSCCFHCDTYFCLSLQGLVMPPQQQHPTQGVMHPNPRNTILFPQQPPQTYSPQGILVQNRPSRWPLPIMQPQQQSRQFPNQSALIAQLTQPSMGPAVNPTALAVTGQFSQSKCLVCF